MASSSFEFTLGAHPPGSARPIEDDAPFHILLLGDFSGRANRGEMVGFADRRPREIDRDNFDDVLGSMGVALAETILDKDGTRVGIEFAELDDFEPDRLYEKLPLFAYLRQTRRRLMKPETFQAAAAEVRGWAQPTEIVRDEPSPDNEVPAAQADAPDGDLLGQALAATTDTGRSGDQQGINWQNLIDELVAPHAVPGVDPDRDKLVECVDAATAISMAAVLHHGDFQTLESAWRGLDLLVRRLETDSRLKIFLFDVAKDELRADLSDDGELQQSAFYRHIVERTVASPGGVPWSLIAGHYTFGDRQDDVDLLSRIARTVALAGSPFVSSADGGIVGCPRPDDMQDFDQWQDLHPTESWAELTKLDQSAYLGLLWPRFLLRLPYGPKTNPISAFSFDEYGGDWMHEHYLWGSPVIAFACMLGQSFTRSGGALAIGDVCEVGNLPLHVRDVDGELEARACGEVLLSERGVARAIDAGVMPLVSVLHQDVLRLVSATSITGKSLQGRWSSAGP